MNTENARKKTFPNNITVEMNNEDAMDLWCFVRDALEEDRKGKDSGRGGFVRKGDEFKLLECLGDIAIGIENYKTSVIEDKNQTKLDI